MQTGTVIRSTGSWYWVRLDEDGAIWKCRILGKFRLEDLPLTNPVAVGDRVEIRPEREGQGLITQILPRRNYVVRQSPRRKHDLHLLAANIDQAMLITTVVQPDLKPGFIDRFLLMTEPHEIPVIIVFNKGDLYDERAVDIFFEMKAIYEKIGYSVLATSVVERKGLEKVKEVLRDKRTLLAGQSGVGKSSLINAIQPHLNLRVGELSDYSGKGKHTTTFAEMLDLDFGGHVIDTPGIKTLSFNNLDPQNVAHSFREFFHLSAQCRFGAACLHRNEPECAVRLSLERGKVSELRYFNYLAILEEIEEINYWERRKEL
ncbi:MAG: ribosome small subunit-dependent GTPase A [Saprospiraceae bacterium]|nr:ribosome small subunit-dependent GTPase A [Saprospiraceae bacterium]MDW8485144.1 ribosome small subunit-dependent GTPase A [Saprospiraceae bacterium]